MSPAGPRVHPLLRPLAVALALMLALAMSATPARGQGGVQLNPSVVVSGPQLKLGDLFAGAGAKADQVIAYAPAPGKYAVLDARWLQRLAGAYGLAWTPLTPTDTAIVRRASQAIGRDEVEAALQDELRRQGIEGPQRIELADSAIRIHVADDAPATLAVEDLALDRRSGRFAATVVAAAGHPGQQRLRVAGRIHETAAVPVLVRPVRGGAVIRAEDVELVTMRADRLARNAIEEPSALIGMAARHSLRPGVSVRSSDVRRPLLVTKGKMVTVVLKSGAMTLTARGIAKEHGSAGDIVPIHNASGNTLVEGEVVAADTVVVVPATARLAY